MAGHVPESGLAREWSIVHYQEPGRDSTSTIAGVELLAHRFATTCRQQALEPL
jgi:hypothetical protein